MSPRSTATLPLSGESHDDKFNDAMGAAAARTDGIGRHDLTEGIKANIELTEGEGQDCTPDDINEKIDEIVRARPEWNLAQVEEATAREFRMPVNALRKRFPGHVEAYQRMHDCMTRYGH